MCMGAGAQTWSVAAYSSAIGEGEFMWQKVAKPRICPLVRMHDCGASIDWC